MKLATWNVNSLKVRLPQVLQWLESSPVDVLCLQETKLTDDKFPVAEIEAAGYQVVFTGQKTYNGVAILSRHPITEVVKNNPLFPDEQQRIISATIEGMRIVCAYVPNGQAVGSDKYDYKLRWLEALIQWLEAELQQFPSLAVLGDYNIAPADADVWDTKALEGSTHVSAPERARLQALADWGLHDVVREQHPEPGIYSWWDYRNGSFHRGWGMRIDLALVTKSVANNTTWSAIDRNARKGEQPSDHAPVLIEVST